jgi:SAM-dependent methyltransferase
MQLTDKRSETKELMDLPGNYSQATMEATYREINTINAYLLGDFVILKEIEKMCRKSNKKSITVLDLGCGNGDLLLKINNLFTPTEIQVTCVGYDPYLSTTGGSTSAENNMFLYDDWDHLISNHSIDIATTSLTLHHLYGLELEVAIERLIQTPKIGFVICDLMRNVFAYYAILVLTRIFSRSLIAKNDAPLSVLRGFSRKEMQEFQKNARVVADTILKPTIAFRWILSGEKI